MNNTYYTLVKRFLRWEGGQLLQPRTFSTIPMHAYEGRKQDLIKQIEQRWPGAILISEEQMEREQLRRFQQIGLPRRTV